MKKKTPISLVIEELKLIKEDYAFNRPSQVEAIEKAIQIVESYIDIEKAEIIKIVNDGYEIGIQIKTGFNSAEEYYYHNYSR